MKKIITFFICIFLLCPMICSAATMYAPDGRSIQVNDWETEQWRNVGWYEYPVVMMYAPDGRNIIVASTDVYTWETVGWIDGRKTVEIYASDGRSAIIPLWQLQQYLHVGWYSYPVTTMYAPNGSTIVINKNEISAYKNVGWYTTYEDAQAATTPAYTDNYHYEPNYINHPNSGGSAIYRTPSGKRYHFDPDCGGKNSYQTTLQKAKSAGLTPCKKCT